MDWNEIIKKQKEFRLESKKMNFLKGFKNIIGSISLIGNNDNNENNNVGHEDKKEDNIKSQETQKSQKLQQDTGFDNKAKKKKNININYEKVKKRMEVRNMLDAKFIEGRLNPMLRELAEAHRLEGIFISDAEGLPVASFSFLKLDEELFASSSASIVSSSQMISSDLGKGNINRISIETDEGIIVFSQINDYIIAIVAKEDIKLGILRGAMGKIEDLLSKKA